MVYDEFVDNPKELEQVYNTETGKYNYKLIEVTDKKNKPVIVKSTGEVKLKKIGKMDYTDKYQICYFSEGEGCSNCSHKNYCIFDDDRIILEEDLFLDNEGYNIIKKLKADYDDYWNILNCIKQYNEIIYHEDFKEHYDIRIEKTVNDNGDVKHKTNVTLKDKKKFIQAIERRCDSIKNDVKYYDRQIKREISDIING
jgi:hypothetical protein